MDLDDPVITRKGILAIQLHVEWSPAEIHFKDFVLDLNPFEHKLKDCRTIGQSRLYSCIRFMIRIK